MKQRLWFTVLAIWTRHTPRIAAPSHYDGSTPLSALHYHLAGWLATITLFLTMAATARKPRWRSLAKSLRPQTCGTCGHPHYKVFGAYSHALCSEYRRRESLSKLKASVAGDLMMRRALDTAKTRGGFADGARVRHIRSQLELGLIEPSYTKAILGPRGTIPTFHTTE